MYAEFYVGDTCTFWHQFHHTDFVATDATGTPTYAVYEETTDTAILSGNLAKLDDAGTTGLYRGQVTLSAANGLEVGKMYVIRVAGTVSGNAQAWIVARFVIRNNYHQKWIRNLVTHNLNTRTFTLYDDDGATVLATRTYSESDTSTGTIIRFPALT